MTPQQSARLGPVRRQFLRPLGLCFGECRLLDPFEIYGRGLRFRGGTPECRAHRPGRRQHRAGFADVPDPARLGPPALA